MQTIATPTTTPIRRAVRDDPPVAALPSRRTLRGPLTTSRLRRSALVLGVLWLTGACLALAFSSPGLHALGLGLAVPGGGFLVGGHWLAALATVLAFALAFGWFFMGNVFAPVGVWAGAAIASVAIADGAWAGAPGIVLLVLGAAIAAGAAARATSVAAARRRAKERAAFLARRAPEIAARPVAEPRAGARELSEDQLAHLRFALDRGLQPLDEFNGLEGVGPDDRLQYFETSLRYQMCQLGWTLSHAHYAFMPSFQGYIAAAQRNFVEKMLHPRVWSYWELQNLWGNAHRDADPVKRDNIMYSGYYAYLLAGYLSNTHDNRYDAPGSLTFEHADGRRYEYDIHRLLDAVMDNFRSSPYCLFPCEPGWSYTMCNGYARLALPVYDRLYGIDLSGEIGREYVDRLEDEFATLDGRYPMAINLRTGLTLSRIGRSTPMFDAIATWQLAPVNRPIARRTYELMREYRLKLRPGEPVDLDLNVFPDGMRLAHLIIQDSMWTYAAVLAAAAEMGDTELVDQLRIDIAERFPATTENGVKRFDGASVYSQTFLLLGLLSAEGEHADRINNGIPEKLRTGPLLAGCAYPDVLVARAFSDGADLQLVLRPGATAGRHRLELAQLAPARTYHVTGAVESSVVADTDGAAGVHVDLAGRTEVRLTPAC